MKNQSTEISPEELMEWKNAVKTYLRKRKAQNIKVDPSVAAALFIALEYSINTSMKKMSKEMIEKTLRLQKQNHEFIKRSLKYHKHEKLLQIHRSGQE